MAGAAQNETQRSECLKKVQSHLPTSSTNEDLVKLQIVGSSVFDSEKSHVMKLIAQAEQSRGHFKRIDDGMRPSGLQNNFKLFWFEQDQELPDQTTVFSEGDNHSREGTEHSSNEKDTGSQRPL